MAFQDTFAKQPLLSWAIDSWEQFYDMLKRGFNLSDELKRYKERSFDTEINQLFYNAPLSLNLGGATEKSRLYATDKPIGVFDFSLASKSLYRVPEFYSQRLATEFPDRFKEFELPSGVVPPNLVKEEVLGDTKRYYFEDDNQQFDCILQQKGKAAIDQKIPDAKLKYATRNKKVYLTYKRNRGKVKYVEIYSLFYYTHLDGDVQFAVRHIPAMMVAEYLESIGVMTRIYMTRFVQLQLERYRRLRTETPDGHHLPMSDLGTQVNEPYLFIQPIIAKEFGQEFDKELAFMISSDNFQNTYYTLALEAQDKEISSGREAYGDPSWSQNEYWEGIERYRNKYKKYVDLGIFKSKEVLPEAMLFFHDMAIRQLMSGFMYRSRDMLYESKGGVRVSDGQTLLDVDVNPFFNWWMRMSATNLKNKINIINSNELRKDIADIESDLNKMIDEGKLIVENIPNNLTYDRQSYKSEIKSIFNNILRIYNVFNQSNQLSFKNYILSITSEITTYAEGEYFPTPQEEIDKRNELVKNVLMELQNF